MLLSPTAPFPWRFSATEEEKLLYPQVLDHGITGDRAAKNQTFQCFATAECYIYLSVREGGRCIDNSMFESKPLAFMNRYGPGRFQRVLAECPRNRFGNFFCLLVDGVFDVAPRLFFHLYLIPVFPDYRDFIRVIKTIFPIFPL